MISGRITNVFKIDPASYHKDKKGVEAASWIR